MLTSSLQASTFYIRSRLEMVVIELHMRISPQSRFSLGLVPRSPPHGHHARTRARVHDGYGSRIFFWAHFRLRLSQIPGLKVTVGEFNPLLTQVHLQHKLQPKSRPQTPPSKGGKRGLVTSGSFFGLAGIRVHAPIRVRLSRARI